MIIANEKNLGYKNLKLVYQGHKLNQQMYLCIHQMRGHSQRTYQHNQQKYRYKQ
jgi:hypothetical protein